MEKIKAAVKEFYEAHPGISKGIAVVFVAAVFLSVVQAFID